VIYDGATILGVGTLSGGQASISTVMLQSGNRKLRAYYQGNGTYAASSSASVPQSVVAGASLGLRPPQNIPSTHKSYAAAVGDFNGDSRQDLAIVSWADNCVTIYLGNGDGTFQSGVNYAVGTSPNSVAVGDFNGDGRMDLAVANYSGGSISILLGNGDGTFQAAVNYQLQYVPLTVAVADFNGDGKADLAAMAVSGDVVVLLGNGDGTFQSATSFPAVGFIYFSNPALAIADVNGDGYADFAVTNALGTVVLLGNGDGTFQAARSVAAEEQGGIGIIGTDLNGDGQADLFVYGAYSESWVLLGNGDGTFTVSSFTTANGTNHGAFPTSALIADFDGDGKPDLALIYDWVSAGAPSTPIGLLQIMPGNGDGTFGAAVTYPVAQGTTFGVVGEFNGDGESDVALGNPDSTGFSVLLGGDHTTLKITSSHSDPFAISQSGAYTITVTNVGGEPTSGTVTVTDTLPSQLSLSNETPPGGGGWTNNLNLSFSYSDSVLPGQSFPQLVLPVTVNATTTGPCTNEVSVIGGGAPIATASDPTSIVGPPVFFESNPDGLQISVDGTAVQTPTTLNLAPGNHTLSTSSPQIGPGTNNTLLYWLCGSSYYYSTPYTLTVGTVSTECDVQFQSQYLLTILSSPPSGGSFTPAPGAYYSYGAAVTITATPNPPFVFAGWSGSLTGNPLQLLFGTAPISITANFDIPGATCTMTGDATASVADVQFIVNESLGIVPANNDLNNDGVVNIADIQRVLNAALNSGCFH
jgi:uncharacterized repeat protein (TIGR01451 family)